MEILVLSLARETFMSNAAYTPAANVEAEVMTCNYIFLLKPHELAHSIKADDKRTVYGS